MVINFKFLKGVEMKFLILMTVLLVSIAFANETENVRAEVPNDVIVGSAIPSGWDGPLAELFNTGPWWNSAGTGVGGMDESILEAWGTTYGYGCQLSATNLIADDFEVPAGQTWEITGITVGGYQTGSGTTPTINGLYLAGYDDPPTTGTVVYGDIGTNVFTSAIWSDIYRVNEAGTGVNSDRPIMAVTATFSTSWIAPEGTYWIGWQLDGTASSGPWAPPVVIMGTQDTGNGLQSVDGGILWEPVENGGAPQGLLLIIEGNVMGALEQSTWGSIKTIF